MRGHRVAIYVLAIGFAMSFWWLGPMVVASFVAGMWFMWSNYKKIEVIRDGFDRS